MRAARHGFEPCVLRSHALQGTWSELSPPIGASACFHEGVQRGRILTTRDNEKLYIPSKFDVGDVPHYGTRRHRHVFGRQHDAETRAHQVVQTLSAMTGSIDVAVQQIVLPE